MYAGLLVNKLDLLSAMLISMLVTYLQIRDVKMDDNSKHDQRNDKSVIVHGEQ